MKNLYLPSEVYIFRNLWFICQALSGVNLIIAVEITQFVILKTCPCLWRYLYYEMICKLQITPYLIGLKDSFLVLKIWMSSSCHPAKVLQFYFQVLLARFLNTILEYKV